MGAKQWFASCAASEEPPNATFTATLARAVHGAV